MGLIGRERLHPNVFVVRAVERRVPQISSLGKAVEGLQNLEALLVGRIKLRRGIHNVDIADIGLLSLGVRLYCVCEP